MARAKKTAGSAPPAVRKTSPSRSTRKATVSRPTRTLPAALASPTAASVLPANYAKLLRELKARVRSAQIKAATSVNQELIALYLHIGQRLAWQDKKAGWGDRVVERLAKDLRTAFPAMSGFSRTNLFYMRQVYLAWEGAG